MKKLTGLCPEKVFKYFEELCSIPHGSSNMEKISDWCVEFAKERHLRTVKDSACNVVIFKSGSAGYENASPVILQGHLDMVCQKSNKAKSDFETDGLDLFVDGDFVGAENTSLGGDDGIGIAMILAILDSDDIAHPPIEAVFTADEEIGMIGAGALDKTILSAKQMINLDSEEFNTLTVSCAGGSEVTVDIPLIRQRKDGETIKIALEGLRGGHSGVEINKNRVNASSLLGRVLNHLKIAHRFDLISISGGDKTNAITRASFAEILSNNAEKCCDLLKEHLESIRCEIASYEPDFSYEITRLFDSNASVIERKISDGIINFLAAVPQGVIQMSADIPGLVETSQNLGIVRCDRDLLTFVFSLRSNKSSALLWLEERLRAMCENIVSRVSVSGVYPPWEYQATSKLQELWCKAYKKETGAPPKIEAIHAGLECGIFSDAIPGLDCISIGPDILDIHTPNERLCISSTEKTYKILLEVLKEINLS